MRVSRLLAILVLWSCAPPGAERAFDADARAAITGAMERYQAALRAVDTYAMAAFFAPDAMLLEPGIPPIEGDDAIRGFLASFPGVRVDSAVATPDTIEVLGDVGLLWGSYFERLAFPGQPVSEQHGRFLAQWSRQADGSWRIRRLWRIPVPAP